MTNLRKIPERERDKCFAHSELSDLLTVDCLHIKSLKEKNVQVNLKHHIVQRSISITESMKGHAGELTGALKLGHGTQGSRSKMSSTL